ncbi:MAG: carboxypeptidase-like regulatory domain-containing protein [Clostridia bacterium]|nr:carboxypeptidase-like regulatory domain-containing protein [Clostridia bacterium]
MAKHFHDTETLEMEYEIKESTVKFGDENAESVGCVGSFKHELESKVLTMQCEGKTITIGSRGTGTGTATINMHTAKSVYQKMYGMKQQGLKAGVTAFGEQSRYPEFCYTAKVMDENGVAKLTCYPHCRAAGAPPRDITNGTEEIANAEITVSLAPDEYGNCFYDIEAAYLDEEQQEEWLDNWTHSMVISENSYSVGMTVSPATAKVVMVNDEGVSVGRCKVLETGVVSIPKLFNGTYHFTAFAEGYTTQSGEIVVDGASPTPTTITLVESE